MNAGRVSSEALAKEDVLRRVPPDEASWRCHGLCPWGSTTLSELNQANHIPSALAEQFGGVFFAFQCNCGDAESSYLKAQSYGVDTNPSPSLAYPVMNYPQQAAGYQYKSRITCSIVTRACL
jgi:hypothetical protein